MIVIVTAVIVAARRVATPRLLAWPRDADAAVAREVKPRALVVEGVRQRQQCCAVVLVHVELPRRHQRVRLNVGVKAQPRQR